MYVERCFGTFFVRDDDRAACGVVNAEKDALWGRRGTRRLGQVLNGCDILKDICFSL